VTRDGAARSTEWTGARRGRCRDMQKEKHAHYYFRICCMTTSTKSRIRDVTSHCTNPDGEGDENLLESFFSSSRSNAMYLLGLFQSIECSRSAPRATDLFAVCLLFFVQYDDSSRYLLHALFTRSPPVTALAAGCSRTSSSTC
jgi:hypothetical protein